MSNYLSALSRHGGRLVNSPSQARDNGQAGSKFVNSRSEVIMQRKMQDLADNSATSRASLQMQAMASSYAVEPIQLKGGKKAKERRKKKSKEKAVAYREKLEQRQMDSLVGSGVREQLNVANPLRSDAARNEDMEKLSNMDDPDRKAWAKSLSANMHLLPEGYVPTLTEAPGQGYSGLTSFNDHKKEVQVRYDPKELEEGDTHKRIGGLAATFTHELALHGPNLHGDVDEEHEGMYSPGRRDQYLVAVHRTFCTLDNDDQKRAFASEWRVDVFNHINWDDALSAGEKRQRRDWANQEYHKMLDAVERPTKYDWAI
jgi:hypothetical protein